MLRERHLLGALLTVLVTSVLCAPLITFTPVLVKDVFHADAGHFSTAVASFGIGGLLGAFGLLGGRATESARRLSSMFALTLRAVLGARGAQSGGSWRSYRCSCSRGASMTVSNTAANSALQRQQTRRCSEGR